jgi:hypothetical protein
VVVVGGFVGVVVLEVVVVVVVVVVVAEVVVVDWLVDGGGDRSTPGILRGRKISFKICDLLKLNLNLFKKTRK